MTIRENPKEFEGMDHAAALQKAGNAVFSADKKLGRRYQTLPEAVERARTQPQGDGE
ncbi:MAG: hypothetical protein WDO56_03885 [Gammaproteobacteria bacterium]